MIKELDSVVLQCDLPKYGLSRGDVGTIVLVHTEHGYEVEFATLEGETLAIVSLSKDEVRPIAAREIASARVVASP